MRASNLHFIRTAVKIKGGCACDDEVWTVAGTQQGLSQMMGIMMMIMLDLIDCYLPLYFLVLLLMS